MLLYSLQNLGEHLSHRLLLVQDQRAGVLLTSVGMGGVRPVEEYVEQAEGLKKAGHIKADRMEERYARVMHLPNISPGSQRLCEILSLAFPADAQVIPRYSIITFMRLVAG